MNLIEHNVELNMLGYYLEKFGNSEYARSVAEGSKARGDDIHTQNQKAMGLATRDQAKTAILNLGFHISNGMSKCFKFSGRLLVS